MNNNATPPRAGWTAAKVIAMIFAVIGMTGFGIGGLCGLLFVTVGYVGALTFAIPGVLIAAIFVWIIIKIQRSVDGKR